MKTSVAICTYNGEKYIKNQIDSILNQSIAVDEIIICDDCSNDNTLDILKEYQKKFPDLIKIFVNETNLRTVKNFEKAISLCSNEIIFLSDQDDIWMKNKVETILDFFIKNKNINCVATNGECIDNNGLSVEGFIIWDVIEYLSKNKIAHNYLDLLLLSGNFATGATMAFRKKIATEFLPFPIKDNFYHDEWMAIVASEKEEFSFLNEKLIKYRLHQNQQVGSVLVGNKEKTINIFTRNYDQLDFKSLKFMLKKAVIFNNTKLVFFKNEEIRMKVKGELFYKIDNIKHIMKKRFYLNSQLLIFFDKFTGKRKFS